MSFTIINNLFIERQNNLTGNAVKVYLYLARCVNAKENQNMVYPSYTAIRRNTGIRHNQSIKNALEELVFLGWIEKIEHGRNDNNIYFLGSIENEEDYKIRLEEFQKLKSVRSQEITERTQVVKEMNHGSQGDELPVVKEMNHNNTNLTSLINNTYLNPISESYAEAPLSEMNNQISSIEGNSNTSLNLEIENLIIPSIDFEIENLFSGSEVIIPENNNLPKGDELENEIYERLLNPDNESEIEFLSEFNLDKFPSPEIKFLYKKLKEYIPLWFNSHLGIENYLSALNESIYPSEIIDGTAGLAQEALQAV